MRTFFLSLLCRLYKSVFLLQIIIRSLLIITKVKTFWPFFLDLLLVHFDFNSSCCCCKPLLSHFWSFSFFLILCDVKTFTFSQLHLSSVMNVKVKSSASLQLSIVFCNAFITSLTSVKISSEEATLQCAFETFCNENTDKFIHS